MNAHYWVILTGSVYGVGDDPNTLKEHIEHAVVRYATEEDAVSVLLKQEQAKLDAQRDHVETIATRLRELRQLRQSKDALAVAIRQKELSEQSLSILTNMLDS